MNVILFDDPAIRQALLPLTFTRPVAEIRVGILTIAEKWEHKLKMPSSYLTEGYLSDKYPTLSADDNLLINGGLCPNDKLLLAIDSLQPGEALCNDQIVLAARSGEAVLPAREQFDLIEFKGDYTLIPQPWYIYKQNAAQIGADFEMLTKDRAS
ncbi:MAG: putative sugar nucleotidyl transferase, partial [Fulvivirga sp.]|nr:putative sugar nucleotidyl transferase [Fulvivirga sp.]